MIDCGVVPNVITYSIIIRMFLINNDLDKALELFEQMKSLDIKPNDVVYSSLINEYFKRDNLDKIIELFEEMKS
jgi:pentatricopeptide repeat protein